MDLNQLSDDLKSGDRRALAQAITLIESTREDHQAEAQALFTELLPHTGNAVRIGISGVPGVGKSTFIESFGLHVIGKKHKVAVLAVDPSSKRTGGSIMGDKTRMGKLANHPDAFIRPSPTGGTLGGVARRTREAMLLCEAAGYDVVMVETVGVGQSETEVADMVDMFLLLLSPAGGDELQGIKKGIVELADLLIVNKADGDLLPAAKRAQADYKAALRLLTPAYGEWRPSVELCSALEGTGLDNVWQSVESFTATMKKVGMWDAKRASQAVAWMWKEIRERLQNAFSAHPHVATQLAAIEKKVENHILAPAAAAQELLGLFLGKKA